MGRKYCLFVCYREQVSIKLWMVEGVATVNGGLCGRTVENKIKSRIGERCRQVVFFLCFFFDFFLVVFRR
jgi:hypothetical protein